MAAGDFRAVPTSMAHRLIHPKPAILVISRSPEGRVNGMIAAWATPLSFNPPLVGVSIAPSRYTHEVVKSSGELTLNVMDRRYVRQVHFIGTVSGRGRDKLSEAGLTLMDSRRVRSPHVSEAMAVLECVVEREVPAGDHTLFIARIVDAYARRGVFDEVYRPDRAKILMHLGGSEYATIADELITP